MPSGPLLVVISVLLVAGVWIVSRRRPRALGECAHAWGWPRRRGKHDIQVCTSCGGERKSLIQFGTPQLVVNEMEQEPRSEGILRAREAL